MPLRRLSLAGLVIACVALPWAVASAQTTHAQRAKPKIERREDGAQQYRPGDIVCTKAGCRPLPAGCHAVNDETWEGPTGYVIIVCP